MEWLLPVWMILMFAFCSLIYGLTIWNHHPTLASRLVVGGGVVSIICLFVLVLN